MAVPELTLEERRRALEKAAAARKRRAEVRLLLKRSELGLPDLFEMAEEDEAIAKMRVISLLEALPRIGRYRANSIMEEIGIAPTRRVRGLGRTQRTKLISHPATSV